MFKHGPRIDFSNVKTLRQGDFIMYDGKFGVVIEDEAYTLGLRCDGRSLKKILDTRDEVYKLVWRVI
jgi:hypothetical protein